MFIGLKPRPFELSILKLEIGQIVDKNMPYLFWEFQVSTPSRLDDIS